FHRLGLGAALANARPVAIATAAAGLCYAALGGTSGAPALAPSNLGPLVVLIIVLPLVANGAFYAERALGPTRAVLDGRLVARVETLTALVSTGLAVEWLRFGSAPPPE